MLQNCFLILYFGLLCSFLFSRNFQIQLFICMWLLIFYITFFLVWSTKNVDYFWATAEWNQVQTKNNHVHHCFIFFFKFEKTWSRKTKISSANEHAKVYFIFYPFIVSSFHKFNGPAMHLGLKIFSPVWKFCCLCLTSQQNYNRQTLDFSERVPISHWEFCQNFLSNWSNKWMLHLENIRNFDSK